MTVTFNSIYTPALSFGGTVTYTGAFTFNATLTGNTTITYPTSGTLATVSQIPTGAALTEVNDTNVTLTLGGSPATALINAASITAGWTGQLGLTRGGTNASLVASNGGMVYSTGSALAILAGTATANQIPLSGINAAPSWSTATYPATTTINQLLYSSATNTITGLATANSATLVTSAGGVPSLSQTLPSAVQGNITSLGTITSGVWNGTAVDVAHGGTGNTTFTAYSVICAGTTATGIFQNVSGVGTAGQVLTSAGASALPTWSNPVGGLVVNQNSASVTMVAGNRYFINNGASLVTLTLPTSASQGDTFIIRGGSSGGWKVAQNANQTINFDTTATTTGIGGSVASTSQYNCISIECITANTTFVVTSSIGSITII